MLERLKTIFLNNIIVRTAIKWSSHIRLPGFEGMTLYDTIAFLFESFQKAQYGTRSAAISFKFFTAIFPSLVFLLSLIPYIPIDHFQEDLLFYLSEALPSNAFSLVEETMNDLITRKHNVLLSIGFLFSLYYASNGLNALLNSFNNSYQIEVKRNPIKQRLISFGGFAVITIFIIAVISSLIIGEIAIKTLFQGGLSQIGSILFHLIRWVIIIGGTIFSVSTLYNIGNPGRKQWKFFSAGATLATIIIILASKGLIYYFDNFGKYNELYGSIGSLLIVLIWIQTISYILLIGFELSTRTDSQINSNTSSK